MAYMIDFIAEFKVIKQQLHGTQMTIPSSKM